MSDLPNDAYWVVEGRLMAGPYPAAPDESGTREKLNALTKAGVTQYLDLTEPGELNWEDIPLRDYRQILKELSQLLDVATGHTRVPIRDVSTPSAETMRKILDHLGAQLASGDVVYVHCWGGTGRTGTVVGCHLVEAGMPPDRVIGHIADLRSGLVKAHKPSPQTDDQVDFVLRWASR